MSARRKAGRVRPHRWAGGCRRAIRGRRWLRRRRRWCRGWMGVGGIGCSGVRRGSFVDVSVILLGQGLLLSGPEKAFVSVVNGKSAKHASGRGTSGKATSYLRPQTLASVRSSVTPKLPKSSLPYRSCELKPMSPLWCWPAMIETAGSPSASLSSISGVIWDSRIRPCVCFQFDRWLLRGAIEPVKKSSALKPREIRGTPRARQCPTASTASTGETTGEKGADKAQNRLPM